MESALLEGLGEEERVQAVESVGALSTRTFVGNLGDSREIWGVLEGLGEEERVQAVESVGARVASPVVHVRDHRVPAPGAC